MLLQKFAINAKLLIVALLFVLFALAGCSQETGQLAFRVNGEDFVRQGFVSKDGWQISFDHIFVTLDEVTAYQTDPPYDASLGTAPDGDAVALEGPQTVDIAQGGADAEPILLGTVEAPVGQYNAISWRMLGDDEGNTLRMVGTAEKDGTPIAFDIGVDMPFAYSCGEYVGDVRKGFVTTEDAGEVEITLHFDHIFGDAETAADEAINVGALGFEPLAAIADGDQLTATLSDLEMQMSSADYALLQETLATLGHVGEGHCYERSAGYTGAQ